MSVGKGRGWGMGVAREAKEMGVIINIQLFVFSMARRLPDF